MLQLQLDLLLIFTTHDYLNYVIMALFFIIKMVKKYTILIKEIKRCLCCRRQTAQCKCNESVQ